MNLIIQGSKNFNVSERIKSHIKKRSEKLNYFKSHIQELNFHLDAERYNFKVDAILNLKKLGVHKFKAIAPEMYTAIDKIIHKIDVKINREKNRIQSHAKPGHEELVEFFNYHERNTPEPTEIIEINTKPTTLQDALLQMKESKKDFYGFYLLEADKEPTPAFLRMLDDHILYLFTKKSDNTYIEYSLITDKEPIKIDKKIRDIKLKKFNLFQAQKDVLKDEYHFDIFIDKNDNKTGFLFKETNGKWILLKG